MSKIGFGFSGCAFYRFYSVTWSLYIFSLFIYEIKHLGLFNILNAAKFLFRFFS